MDEANDAGSERASARAGSRVSSAAAHCGCDASHHQVVSDPAMAPTPRGDKNDPNGVDAARELAGSILLPLPSPSCSK